MLCSGVTVDEFPRLDKGIRLRSYQNDKVIYASVKEVRKVVTVKARTFVVGK